MEEGEPIEHKLVTRAIGTAQKRVETHNFEIRKHLLEYDDVMNKQREIIYGMRRADPRRARARQRPCSSGSTSWSRSPSTRYAAADAHPEDWDLGGAQRGACTASSTSACPPLDGGRHRRRTRRSTELVTEAVEARYARARAARCSIAWSAGSPARLERHEMLIVIDQLSGRTTCCRIDHLKEGIGLRGYGQRDPLTEYKKEAFDLFQEMVERLKETVVEQLFKVRMIQEDAPIDCRPSPRARRREWQESRGRRSRHRAGAPPGDRRRPEPRTADGQKVGRNDPCHCGSGKKYKKCCFLKGALTPAGPAAHI